MSPEDTAKTAEDNGKRDEKQNLKSLEATGSAFANATKKMKCKNMILFINTNTSLICALTMIPPLSLNYLF